MHRNELVEEGEGIRRLYYTHRSLPRTRNIKKYKKRDREKGNQLRDGMEDEKYVNNPDRIQISSSKPLC